MDIPTYCYISILGHVNNQQKYMGLILYGTRQTTNKQIFIPLNKRGLELKCMLGIIQYNHVKVAYEFIQKFFDKAHGKLENCKFKITKLVLETWTDIKPKFNSPV